LFLTTKTLVNLSSVINNEFANDLGVLTLRQLADISFWPKKAKKDVASIVNAKVQVKNRS
jgi:hypothetical protein